jgi:hypothetical protein
MSGMGKNSIEFEYTLFRKQPDEIYGKGRKWVNTCPMISAIYF